MSVRNLYGYLLAVFVGLVGGIGAYTFAYARGDSYLTNDPAACANCHVMDAHFSGWVKSSHRAVAVCNDCHTPPGVLPKYATKALNGFWHSWAFTTGRFPDSLSMTTRNQRVTESACRKCHADVVEALESAHPRWAEATGGDRALSCIRCHANVGHLE